MPPHIIKLFKQIDDNTITLYQWFLNPSDHQPPQINSEYPSTTKIHLVVNLNAYSIHVIWSSTPRHNINRK